MEEAAHEAPRPSRKSAGTTPSKSTDAEPVYKSLEELLDAPPPPNPFFGQEIPPEETPLSPLEERHRRRMQREKEHAEAEEIEEMAAQVELIEKATEVRKALAKQTPTPATPASSSSSSATAATSPKRKYKKRRLKGHHDDHHDNVNRYQDRKLRSTALQVAQLDGQMHTRRTKQVCLQRKKMNNCLPIHLTLKWFRRSIQLNMNVSSSNFAKD